MGGATFLGLALTVLSWFISHQHICSSVLFTIAEFLRQCEGRWWCSPENKITKPIFVPAFQIIEVQETKLVLIPYSEQIFGRSKDGVESWLQHACLPCCSSQRSWFHRLQGGHCFWKQPGGLSQMYSNSFKSAAL